MPPAKLPIPNLFAGMNKTERAFALGLEAERRAGRIVVWRFEAITLKLAFDTRYTPDFYVLYPSGNAVFYETKGFMRDDANVKLKVAARQFPEFCFVLVQKGVHTEVRP